MKAEIFWLQTPSSGRLGTMAKPRGEDWLETDIQALQQAEVDILVSLLTHPEMIQLGLLEEATHCQTYAIEFISFPIEDRSVPTSKIDARKLIHKLVTSLDEGKNIAIHCRAGIGRSSLIAASVLATYNISTDKAFSIIEECRGLPVPDTPEQKTWVADFIKVYLALG